MRLSFGRLKWLSSVAPIAVIAVLHFVTNFVLDDFFLTAGGFVVTVAVAGVGVYFFAHFVFEVIARLERRVMRQNQNLETSAAVATTLSEATGTDGILQPVLDSLLDSFSLDAGVICLLDEGGESLFATAQRGLAPALLEEFGRAAVSEPVGVEGAVTAEARVRELAEANGFGSLASVPLVTEGRPQGVLALLGREPGRFEDSDVQLLEQIARQVGVALERAVLLDEELARQLELRLLNEASAALSSTLGYEQAVSIALAKVMEVSRAERGELWLRERGQDETFMVLAASVPAEGAGDDRMRTASKLSAASEVLRREVATSGAVLFERQGTMALGCLPLQTEGEVFGTISLEGHRAIFETAQRRRTLASIAERSSVAIPNAQLHDRVQEMAVLEERERIAREMHDGLAQVLGYVNTKAFAIRRSLVDGESAAAQGMLGELEEAAREVYADVREGVLALRSTSPSSRSLLDNLSDYLEKYERMSGIHVAWEASAGVTSLRLPEMTEIQLMRIVQEALSNVRKHAGAKRVVVRLAEGQETITVSVEDDGRGFDLAREGRRDWPQFGLQTMRERAEAIGGEFAVISAPQEGTRVTVRIPVAASREASR